MSAVATKPPAGHAHAAVEAVGASAEPGATAGRLDTPEANRRFYADHAASYDSAEHCVAHAGARHLLEEILDRALEAAPSATPRTLDACGGTGNVSELLARRGIETTVADVSAEMLARWREKAAGLGVAADTVEAEIDSFLANDERRWELIVLSSALHHLDDYVGVAQAAARRLEPGGVLVTAFDPVRSDDRTMLKLRRFDYLLSLLAEPRSLAAAVRRRRDRRSGTDHGVNVGDLAEKHALHGIDDEEVLAALRAEGLEIVEHRRYACQRFRITERLIRARGGATTFHLIARKPGPSTSATASADATATQPPTSSE